MRKDDIFWINITCGSVAAYVGSVGGKAYNGGGKGP